MPYFNNDIINILFIHIPKTGGSSVTMYLQNKYNIVLNNKSLHGTIGNHKHKEPTDKELEIRLFIKSHLQHITYQNLCKYSNFFNINHTNINYITIVRNPYDRIMSGLFYTHKINIDTTPDDLFNILKIYLFTEQQDNFYMPQYLFITNENRELIPNLKILHTENLQADMVSLGYTDFDIKVNCNPLNIDYYKLLNNDSINLINDFYDVDFTLFNYNKYYLK